jgi:hypothetical protein
MAGIIQTATKLKGNTMKTNELVGAALDWAVAKCEGYFDTDMASVRDGVTDVFYFDKWSPSTDWAQGGKIIERERINISPRDGYWEALYLDNLFQEDGSDYFQMGATPLVAAMRCYVASKLGNEVQLPEGLK